MSEADKDRRTVSSGLDEAVKALAAALDVCEREVNRVQSNGQLVSELTMMRADRQELADALNDALGHIHEMERASHEAETTIDQAIVSLRTLAAKA